MAVETLSKNSKNCGHITDKSLLISTETQTDFRVVCIFYIVFTLNFVIYLLD